VIVVRNATSADAEALAAVDVSATATLRETYRPNDRALTSRAKLAGRLTRLVAELDGRVVGTVQYSVDGNSLRIIGLGVHSDARRRGVARAIMDKLREIAVDLGVSQLLAHTVRQTGNVPIFEKLGFEVVSESEDEYSESTTHDMLTDVEMRNSLDQNQDLEPPG